MKFHLATQEDVGKQTSKKVACQISKSPYSFDHGYTVHKSIMTAQELKDWSVKMPADTCQKCLKLALKMLNN